MEDGPTLYYRLILEGIADPDRCALDMECIDAVRVALDEIDRLQERVYALEAEVMQTGGELVIEVGKRMAAERKLGAMEANASAPAAIVQVYPGDRPPSTFAFADADDAQRFCRQQQVAVMTRTPNWKWHR